MKRWKNNDVASDKPELKELGSNLKSNGALLTYL